MKRRFTIILIAFTIMLANHVSAQDGSVNLLVNGDFEDGLTGWTGDAAQIRTYDFFPYSGLKHFAYKVDDLFGGTQVVNGLTAGANYQLSGVLRNNTSTTIEEVRAGVRNYGGDELAENHVFDATGTASLVQDEWTPFSIDFTMGAANTSVEVFIENVQGDNFAYADNFILTKSVSTSLADNKILSVVAWVNNGSLNIKNAAGGQLSILNLAGSSNLNTIVQSNSEVINLSSLPKGMYIVCVLQKGKMYSAKIIN